MNIPEVLRLISSSSLLRSAIRSPKFRAAKYPRWTVRRLWLGQQSLRGAKQNCQQKEPKADQNNARPGRYV